MIPTKEIDELALQTLKEWDIPGMGLSIVYKGNDYKISGYGLKKRESSETVDADTVFQIGSITKSFVALMVSMLVEEGKLSWEVPIRTYIPSFEIKDKYAQEHMTLRDLLTHRTGLPGIAQQAWRIWWNTGLSQEESIKRLCLLEPAFSFRSHFTYSNLAYVLCCKICEKVSQTPWEILCQKKIFEPIGMKRSNLDYRFFYEDDNVASPHKLLKMQKESIIWNSFNQSPSGVNSCARDMAQWLKYSLSNATALKAIQKPQTLLEPEGIFDEFAISSWSIMSHEKPIVNYGYGWMMYFLNDRLVLFHTGLIDGMQSILAVVPDEELGICILSNETIQLGPACLQNILLDRFLGLDRKDWHTKAKEITSRIENNIQKSLQTYEAGCAKNTKPTLSLEQYVGEYKNPSYGTVKIEMNDHSLMITLFNHETGSLKHGENDQFQITNIESTTIFPWIIDFELSPDMQKVLGFMTRDLGFFSYQEA